MKAFECVFGAQVAHLKSIPPAWSRLKPVSHEANECIIMRLLVLLGTVIVYVSMLTVHIPTRCYRENNQFQIQQRIFQTLLFI